MGIEFLVPGTVEALQATHLRGSTGEGTPFAVRHAVRLSLQRGDQAWQRADAEPGQDIVVLRLAGGPELVLHPETARALLMAQNIPEVRGAAGASESVRVPVRLAWQQEGSAHRGGLAEVLLDNFQILRRALAGPAAVTADAIAARFDSEVHAGVHALSAAALRSLEETTRLGMVPAAPPGNRLLVLIHGTFSSTAGTFGKLWSMHPALVGHLFEHYGDRIYALEHATLSLGPAENALALARALPEGAVLHLLTHSRGGLVAEVLARMCAQPQLDDDAAALFAAQPRELDALRALAQVVQTRRLRVERIVRVACPARGTLLASRRLDAYLSVMRWCLTLAQVPVAPALVDFLQEVALQRLDPHRLPGLAAQVPDSPLVQWLHRSGAAIPGQLRVVAGDVEGDSLTSWLKTLASDAFYWSDNDLVVQTRSMYGGSPRADEAAFVLDAGGSVSHFAYFANERTASAAVRALLDDRPEGFRAIGPLSWSGSSASGVRAAPLLTAGSTLPAVVLLPDFGGSHLRAGGQRHWPDGSLAEGLQALAWRPGQDDSVRPDGVVERSYGALLAALSTRHEVIAFDHDWRCPLADEARRLADTLQRLCEARRGSGQPVRVLAHGSGGLLARVMQLECPAAWQSWMDSPGSRLLMLGTPNAGCWMPMQVLSGDDSLGHALDALDPYAGAAAARAVLAGFPGLLQIQQGLLDPELGLARAERWAALARQDLDAFACNTPWNDSPLQRLCAAWGVPTQATLDAALALRRALDRQRDEVLPAFADRILIVLGSAARTPDGFASSDRGLVYLDRIDAGDGRVTDRSARLPGVRAWRAPSDHGRLVQDAGVLAACDELLSTGDTRLLPLADAEKSHPAQDTLPSRPSRTTGRPPSPEATIDPLALPAPTPPKSSATAAAIPLQLQIVNSDLAFVDLPLLIGHYSSLGLTGSEAVVDRLLDGALSAALQAGVYPQQAGRQQVFLNRRLPADNPWQAPRPEAVVVIGLGPEGSLRPAALTGAVRDGVIAWALRLAEREDAPARFALAATLLGSGGLNIDAGPCAQLIAQGVREAADRLATLPHPRRTPWPRPQRLVLVDLYLDRANEAWQALATLQQSRPRDFELEPAIQRTGSALDRPLDAGYRGADYDLVTATAQRDASGQPAIAYRIDTRRARAQVQAQATQGPLLQRLLAAATDTPGRTLFQLLVPPELQSFLSGATDTQIEVDATTAAIPWELLEPPAPRGEAAAREPWALRARLLRKLRCEDLPWAVHDADRDEATLVIGEPACPSGYGRLPGARREAGAVAQALGSGRLKGGVRSLIADEAGGPDAAAVVNALFERDWRIVHLCGHGEAPHDGDPRGVVLSDGVFLGPREIRNLRAVPELVFVNCCFSGARAADGSARLPGFAANVAEQLIRGGVRCVVATGWAVADDAAEAFAQAFYASLLDGARFLDAVARGRAAAFAHGGITWGAYQCYGDPDWRLRRGVADAQRPDAALHDPLARIASVPALLLALRTLAVQSAYQGRRAEAAPQLRALATRFEARWGRRGDVAEAFGRAFDAAGDTDDALHWLERAAGAADGRASLDASDTLFNLRARRAWDRLWASRSGERERAAREALRDIQAALDALLALGRLWPSSERSSLCGSAFKRMALVHALLGQPEEADRCVDAMCEHYRFGRDLAQAAPEGELFYPAINLLAGTLASGRLDPAELAAAQALAQQQRLRAPDFFNTAAAVELHTWQALAEGRLADELPALRLAFTDLHDRVSDVSKWRSLHDQAWFVTTGWQRRQATPAAAQAEACGELMALLAAWAWPAAAPHIATGMALAAPPATSTTTTGDAT